MEVKPIKRSRLQCEQKQNVSYNVLSGKRYASKHIIDR